MVNFKFKIDDEIKHMFFFKGTSNTIKEDHDMDEDDIINKPKGLLKKNYIYVTTDGKLKVKNLGLAKKSISPLTKRIFNEHLTPSIKDGQIKFSKTYIKSIIDKLLSEDLMLAASRKNVGAFKDYASESSIQSQIAKQYGPGIHFMIPNLKNVGVGKGKSYCTMEEFKARKLTVDDIDLEGVWKELGYFIKPIVMKNIFDFAKD